jgi:ATP-dependent helicase/nuclease subunit A
MTDAAFEHNGATVARERFYAIACDPGRSVAVEACAGAGKTWMLVSRMVRALLDGSAPHEILAITFTKKAAGEMRQRLQEWLLHFAQQDDAALRQELLLRGLMQEPTLAQLQTLRQLHATLLASGRPVQIRTFHSWFAALLRSAPLQALADLGLPAHYELLQDDAQAVALAWPRFQTRVANDASARADYLAAVATYGRFQAQSALDKRVEFALADAQGVVETSVQPFAQQFPEMAGLQTPQALLATASVHALLQDAARLLGASSLATCQSGGADLEQAMTRHDASGIVTALLTQKGTPRKFSEKLAGIATVREAQDCVIRLQAAQAQHEAWLHQQRMARLSRMLVVEYAQLKRERGWIDMGDLERAALALMSDPVLSGWVQERLDARVRHLMIDEFQDTNPLQWQALSAWLSSYTGAGQAPSVFLVGDPKQSIYRFRRAEPQVFKAAQRFVGRDLGGDLLACDHTRRNAPAIIDLVNRVMQDAQAAGGFDGYRSHSTESNTVGQVWRLPRVLRSDADGDTTAGSDATGSLPPEAVWRDSLTQPRVVTEETRKTLECRQAARWLAQQFQDTTLKPQDVMVLARKRERLGLMQAELAALHIPAQQPEKTELADMPEVQDLVALLDVLVSPNHDLSLARALKSPIFGVSDADLVQLVLRKKALQAAAIAVIAANVEAGSESEPEATNDASAVVVSVATEPARARVPMLSWMQVLQQPGLPAALQTIGSTLQLWKGWVDTQPPHDALSAIYHHGDVLARYGATSAAHQRAGVLANLRALLSAALQVDGGRYVNAYGLVRALRAGGIRAPMRADPTSVRLLTIHGAKGLEAPLVLMLDTDGESPRSQTMGVLVDWPGEAAYPQRFVFLASETKPPACVAQALAIEQTARLREELNALYVALTRTQKTLVLSSLEPHISNPLSWWSRLHAHAADAPGVDLGTATSASVAADARPFSLLSLPNRPVALVECAQPAIKTVANSDSSGMAADEPDSLESRIGQAMHRLLERYAPPGGATGGLVATQPQWEEVVRAQVAQEFALEPADLDSACAMAQTIVQGEGAWAWDRSQLGWQGNEVAIVHQGRMLRIDRLVHRKAPEGTEGQWWVLDYKSTPQPQLQAALRAQLHTYRSAVAKAYPEHTVRAAFLTAAGTLIEIPAP